MSVSETRFARAVTLMEAELGDEMVALDPEGGLCFGFNPVAASVWRLLDTPRTVYEIGTELTRDYDVEVAQCHEEVAELLFDLQERGLVQRI